MTANFSPSTQLSNMNGLVSTSNIPPIHGSRVIFVVSQRESPDHHMLYIPYKLMVVL